jgi:small subunit ribosomal protein S20
MFPGLLAGHRPARMSPPLIAEVVVPRIKSAKKRMRQGKAHTTRNRTQRSQLRTAIKKVRSAAGPDARTAYAEAVQLIDRAGRKRLMHPNAAARQKRRLSKLVTTVTGK